MARELTEFKVLLEYLKTGWFPLWVGFHDETPNGNDQLTIDWVCRWRVPDGKFFSTETVCTATEQEIFRREARLVWDAEIKDQFEDNKDASDDTKIR